MTPASLATLDAVNCRRFLAAWTRSQARKQQRLDADIVVPVPAIGAALPAAHPRLRRVEGPGARAHPRAGCHHCPQERAGGGGGEYPAQADSTSCRDRQDEGATCGGRHAGAAHGPDGGRLQGDAGGGRPPGGEAAHQGHQEEAGAGGPRRSAGERVRDGGARRAGVDPVRDDVASQAAQGPHADDQPVSGRRRQDPGRRGAERRVEHGSAGSRERQAEGATGVQHWFVDIAVAGGDAGYRVHRHVLLHEAFLAEMVKFHCFVGRVLWRDEIQRCFSIQWSTSAFAAPTAQWPLAGILRNAAQSHLLLEVFDEHAANRHQEDFVVNVRQECEPADESYNLVYDRTGIPHGEQLATENTLPRDEHQPEQR
ncbi:hypothetical protein ON010_g10324 [Phytophthora cinnamomi]|nr:hypothetical protein ON010_g10324 [Phytophthora cinnamomi]